MLVLLNKSRSALILSDIVVMPSVTPEPFGRIILEAQALGKIPIAFDHGGASETIIDGKNGFLADPVKIGFCKDIPPETQYSKQS